MPIQRQFLDWSQPALPAVVDFLLERDHGSGLRDLSSWIVVFPGRQAGRRFLELLVERAGGRCCPPTIVTVGSLPEMLYRPKRPFASALTQRFAWERALQQLPPPLMQSLMRHPPSDEDRAGWLALGELLQSQHAELAADLLSFSDVAQRARNFPGFNETARWEALAEVQRLYLSQLDGLGLWDQQTARLVAIRERECQTEREIMAVGTVDLNRTLRAMLDQVADRVTVMIHAPATEASLFDTFGCLVPEAWREVMLEIRPDQVRMVDDAAGQVAAVVRTLASYEGRYALDDVTVAVPDEQLVPALQRTLEDWGVSTSRGVGRELSRTAPALLLDAVADYLESRRTDHFAALIRHPDMSVALDRSGLPADWLTTWDEYFCEQLPQQIPWQGTGDHACDALLAAVRRLLRPVEQTARLLSEWVDPVLDLLGNIYAGPVQSDRDAESIAALEHLEAAFEELRRLPASLDRAVSASETLRIALEDLSEESLGSGDETGLRLSGWLDMPLDDAPAAIVTSFNEGNIPSSINHDLFLPNGLREYLGLEDNARRYARDCHSLQVLLKGRRDLMLIVARRNLQKDPLKPSRLLFAAPPEQIAERVLTFYEDRDSTAEPRLPVPCQSSATRSGFLIPRPVPRERRPEYMRVTEFKEYLASPYRYYLGRVLKLSSLSDDVRELDPLSFGVLLHEVLHQFGTSDCRDSTDDQEIAAWLRNTLNETVGRKYGKSPLAAVMVQVEQSRRRLEGFARWQAAWRKKGWRIEHVEWDGECPLDLPNGETMAVRGRIDRIDVHEADHRRALFDYKTGDGGPDPEKSHRWKGEWVDLQLPLYHRLARAAGISGELQLGYILLPREGDRVTEHIVTWSSEELEEADEVARQAALEVLQEQFWKPLEEPSGAMPEFNGICQTHVFGQEVHL